MTPFGPMDQHSSRNTLYLLIATLNVAFPDHEFSDVKLSYTVQRLASFLPWELDHGRLDHQSTKNKVVRVSSTHSARPRSRHTVPVSAPRGAIHHTCLLRRLLPLVSTHIFVTGPTTSEPFRTSTDRVRNTPDSLLRTRPSNRTR